MEQREQYYATVRKPGQQSPCREVSALERIPEYSEDIYPYATFNLPEQENLSANPMRQAFFYERSETMLQGAQVRLCLTRFSQRRIVPARSVLRFFWRRSCKRDVWADKKFPRRHDRSVRLAATGRENPQRPSNLINEVTMRDENISAFSFASIFFYASTSETSSIIVYDAKL